jgi:hypothetical protein
MKLHLLSLYNTQDIREQKPGTTVAQKLNQGSIPPSGCIPCPSGQAGMAGLLFWFFFGEAKKNKKQAEVSRDVNPAAILLPSKKRNASEKNTFA